MLTFLFTDFSLSDDDEEAAFPLFHTLDFHDSVLSLDVSVWIAIYRMVHLQWILYWKMCLVHDRVTSSLGLQQLAWSPGLLQLTPSLGLLQLAPSLGLLQLALR